MGENRISYTLGRVSLYDLDLYLLKKQNVRLQKNVEKGDKV